MINSRPLRIAQLIHYFRTGGLEQLALRLAKSHQLLGWTPHVIAYEDGELRRDFEQLGIQTFVLPRPHRFQASFPIAMAHLFQQQRFDLIHTHHIGPLLYGAPAAYLANIPLIHTTHSNEHLQLPEHPHFLRTLPLNLLRDLRCFKQLGELPLCARLLELLSSKQSSQLAHGEASASASATSYRRIYALLAHLCYRIVTVNYELREFLEQSLDIPPQRVAVIPNGVDPLLFHGKYDVSSLRTQLKIPTDLPWIASIGRLEPEKGHRYLLEAVAQLERPVHLLLVGQGSQLDALRDLAHRLGISARTHFLGMRRDIPQILSAIDILALPSLREGLPLVLLEAMASHVPFVASAVGGIPALCAQSQAGITTQSQQTTSIAQALHALLTQPMLRQQMGERGRWWVERHYNQKQMTSHYADLYSSAIQSHNRTLPPVVASLLMQIFAHKSRISTV